MALANMLRSVVPEVKSPRCTMAPLCGGGANLGIGLVCGGQAGGSQLGGGPCGGCGGPLALALLVGGPWPIPTPRYHLYFSLKCFVLCLLCFWPPQQEVLCPMLINPSASSKGGAVFYAYHAFSLLKRRCYGPCLLIIVPPQEEVLCSMQIMHLASSGGGAVLYVYCSFSLFKRRCCGLGLLCF